MKEYIEKAMLYKEIAELEELARKRVLDTPTNSPAYARYVAQLNERTELKHKIYDFPAAEVAEVRHGEWKYDPNGMDCGLGAWVCNVCGCNNNNLGMSERINPYLFSGSKFCPNCGTKMDGENENE